MAYDVDNKFDMPGFEENCLRTTEAYAVQLATDASWTNGRTPKLTFASCSGSRLSNCQAQALAMDEASEFGTLTLGGNDAGKLTAALICSQC